MNFALSNVKLNADWFTKTDSAFQQISIDDFEVYLNLYRFYIPNQPESISHTNIVLIKKQLPKRFTYNDVYSSLLKLQRKNFIKINNITNLTQLKKYGKIDSNRLIAIVLFNEHTYNNDLQSGNYYVSIHLPMYDYYYDIGLNFNHFLVYCVLLKYAMPNKEKKAWPNMETISKTLNINVKTINKLINEMNEKQVIYSKRKTNTKTNKDYLEHFICKDVKELDNFRKTYY